MLKSLKEISYGIQDRNDISSYVDLTQYEKIFEDALNCSNDYENEDERLTSNHVGLKSV